MEGSFIPLLTDAVTMGGLTNSFDMQVWENISTPFCEGLAPLLLSASPNSISPPPPPPPHPPPLATFMVLAGLRLPRAAAERARRCGAAQMIMGLPVDEREALLQTLHEVAGAPRLNLGAGAPRILHLRAPARNSRNFGAPFLSFSLDQPDVSRAYLTKSVLLRQVLLRVVSASSLFDPALVCSPDTWFVSTVSIRFVR